MVDVESVADSPLPLAQIALGLLQGSDYSDGTTLQHKNKPRQVSQGSPPLFEVAAVLSCVHTLDGRLKSGALISRLSEAFTPLNKNF